MRNHLFILPHLSIQTCLGRPIFLLWLHQLNIHASARPLQAQMSGARKFITVHLSAYAAYAV